MSSGESAIYLTNKFVHVLLQFLILPDICPAGDSHLEEHHLPKELRVAGQKSLKGPESVDQPLCVIKSINSQNYLGLVLIKGEEL